MFSLIGGNTYIWPRTHHWSLKRPIGFSTSCNQKRRNPRLLSGPIAGPRIPYLQMPGVMASRVLSGACECLPQMSSSIVTTPRRPIAQALCSGAQPFTTPSTGAPCDRSRHSVRVSTICQRRCHSLLSDHQHLSHVLSHKDIFVLYNNIYREDVFRGRLDSVVHIYHQ